MEQVYDVLTYVHIAAWIVVLLGYVKDARSPQINGLMTHGLEAAFLLGIVLVGIASASDDVADPNHAKIAVKLLVALAAIGVAHSTRKRPAPNQFANIVLGLVFVNILIAYVWR